MYNFVERNAYQIILNPNLNLIKYRHKWTYFHNSGLIFQDKFQIGGFFFNLLRKHLDVCNDFTF